MTKLVLLAQKYVSFSQIWLLPLSDSCDAIPVVTVG